MLNMGSSLDGESHSPVVHELWVLVVAGSNPASPTEVEDKGC